jgi:hypothetical protein
MRGSLPHLSWIGRRQSGTQAHERARQMFTALDAHAQIEVSLTPDQRAKLHRRMRGGGMMMH